MIKLDQIATYAHDEEQADAIKRSLGLEKAEWKLDEVVGRVDLPQRKIVGANSKGLLQFNYDLGIEFEILTYLEGPHWHQDWSDEVRAGPFGVPFLSHIGIHLEGDEFPAWAANFPLVQEMWTESHTNEYVNKMHRRYHYRILDARPMLGYYVKLIRRLRASV